MGRLHRAAVDDSVVMEESEIPWRYQQPELALVVPLLFDVRIRF
jgi:hypothetical protein